MTERDFSMLMHYCTMCFEFVTEEEASYCETCKGGICLEREGEREYPFDVEDFED